MMAGPGRLTNSTINPGFVPGSALEHSHQPRLDWQLWFAALRKPRLDSWFAAFLARLQEGSPPVLALLRFNPFPDHPPVFVRAMLYRYDYSRPKFGKKPATSGDANCSANTGRRPILNSG